jgi:protein-L-isoaspartate(D-aspartate) O-methyltransferase
MTSLAQLAGGETVLEIGTGSGYQAAILSCLASQVHSIERHHALAVRARQTLLDLGYLNVAVHEGDGTLGWPGAAPFHAILVTASAPSAPQPLLDQLAEGGRLVIPVGGRGFQELEVWQRSGKNFEREGVIPVAFVPLRGEHGWNAQDWPEHSLD